MGGARNSMMPRSREPSKPIATSFELHYVGHMQRIRPAGPLKPVGDRPGNNLGSEIGTSEGMLHNSGGTVPRRCGCHC